MKKAVVISSIIVILILCITIWWRYYFVFGEGVKSGSMNFFVRKGYIFKTWEGRIIQEGFKTKVPGNIQSNEFDFSVANDSIAAQLERASGDYVEVRYKEYLNTLPWRGVSNYVVVEVLSIQKPTKHE